MQIIQASYVPVVKLGFVERHKEDKEILLVFLVLD